jgi:hypothetical protein
MMQFSTMTPPVMTEAEALSLVHSGQRVYIGGGCGVPTLLLHALVARAPVLRDVEIIHMLTAGEDPTTAPEYQAAFRREIPHAKGGGFLSQRPLPTVTIGLTRSPQAFYVSACPTATICSNRRNPSRSMLRAALRSRS